MIRPKWTSVTITMPAPKTSNIVIRDGYDTYWDKTWVSNPNEGKPKLQVDNQQGETLLTTYGDRDSLLVLKAIIEDSIRSNDNEQC